MAQTARRHRRERAPPSDEAVLSLHKYYLRATAMLTHLREATLKAAAVHGSEWRKAPAQSAEHFNVEMYRDYWYAAVFVVVEGYNKLGLADHDTEALLASDLVQKLGLYRHGVDHFQIKYFSPTHGALAMMPDTFKWVTDLYFALGHFLLAELAARKALRES